MRVEGRASVCPYVSCLFRSTVGRGSASRRRKHENQRCPEKVKPDTRQIGHTFGPIYIWNQQHTRVNTTFGWVTSTIGAGSPHQGASVVRKSLKRSLLLRVVRTPSPQGLRGYHPRPAAWPSQTRKGGTYLCPYAVCLYAYRYAYRV